MIIHVFRSGLMMFTQEVHICGGVPLPRPPKDILYVKQTNVNYDICTGGHNCDLIFPGVMMIYSVFNLLACVLAEKTSRGAFVCKPQFSLILTSVRIYVICARASTFSLTSLFKE